MYMLDALIYKSLNKVWMLTIVLDNIINIYPCKKIIGSTEIKIINNLVPRHLPVL